MNVIGPLGSTRCEKGLISRQWTSEGTEHRRDSHVVLSLQSRAKTVAESSLISLDKQV